MDQRSAVSQSVNVVQAVSAGVILVSAGMSRSQCAVAISQ
jgi:hypothetical protein